MTQADTTTQVTHLLRSLSDTFVRVDEMAAHEDRFCSHQWDVSTLAPMSNHWSRATVRVKKAITAALIQRVIRNCEADHLTEVERIATFYQALRKDLALSPRDRESERQCDIGHRSDTAEQQLRSRTNCATFV